MGCWLRGSIRWDLIFARLILKQKVSVGYSVHVHHVLCFLFLYFYFLYSQPYFVLFYTLFFCAFFNNVFNFHFLFFVYRFLLFLFFPWIICNCNSGFIFYRNGVQLNLFFRINKISTYFSSLYHGIILVHFMSKLYLSTIGIQR